MSNIKPPKKKYQVFLSSTYQDLKDIRTQILKSLLELDCIPAGMELFPATDEAQLELIKKIIDNCDYYIVVVGGRYGSLHSCGLSYTHLEYQYAQEQGIPCIAFLHRNPSQLPIERCDNDKKLKKKLDQFREELQTTHCKYWNDGNELDGLVSRSLYHLIRDRDRPGWIRAYSSTHSTSIEFAEETLQLFLSFLEAMHPKVHFRILVAIADVKKNRRVTLCGVNIRNDPDAHRGVPLDYGISGKAFIKEHRAIGDVKHNDGEESLTWDEVRSVLSVPLRSASGVVYGTLNVDSTFSAKDSGFQDRQIQQAIDRLANLLGPFFENSARVPL